MVKKTILASLFFILMTGLFGLFTTPALAACVADNVCKTASQACCSEISRDVSGALCPSGQQCVAKTTTKVCDFVSDKAKQADCETCMGNGTAAWTALGCIQTDPSQFIGSILSIGIGIGGGIAFLLILFGGFQILMSAGNPEKLNAGKELITSAITGLLIIIFSLFILRLIGFNIFGIPGFG
ncbi:MAG: hypothetical protein NTY06_01935 [Candidatus Gottesmanbacteria bacterium]|nr:hypothetical protein [Candidatus Gottesmanbacteria bacterium]